MSDTVCFCCHVTCTCHHRQPGQPMGPAKEAPLLSANLLPLQGGWPSNRLAAGRGAASCFRTAEFPSCPDATGGRDGVPCPGRLGRESRGPGPACRVTPLAAGGRDDDVSGGDRGRDSGPGGALVFTDQTRAGQPSHVTSIPTEIRVC